ncbi:hypothetical protein FPOAC2_12754 [Fusarium poae]|jgi:hypothetical protein
MATGTTLWWRLPAEIQNEIVSFLPVVGGNCGQLATVCRTWRSIIEPLNFAEITLNAWRLIEPESQDILSRKKNQIRYIWFVVELRDHGCARCNRYYARDNSELKLSDNQFIMHRLRNLFDTLSA